MDVFGCVYVERLATCKHVSGPAGLVIISHGLNVGLGPTCTHFSRVCVCVCVCVFVSVCAYAPAVLI